MRLTVGESPEVATSGPPRYGSSSRFGPVNTSRGRGHFEIPKTLGSELLTATGFGGPDRDRTDDLFHAMEARSQLRHRPTLSRRDSSILRRAGLIVNVREKSARFYTGRSWANIGLCLHPLLRSPAPRLRAREARLARRFFHFLHGFLMERLRSLIYPGKF